MGVGTRLTSVGPWMPAESLCINGTNLLFYLMCLGECRESGGNVARISEAERAAFIDEKSCNLSFHPCCAQGHFLNCIKVWPLF